MKTIEPSSRPPMSEHECAAIREQLQRMLAHPVFRQSRRYTRLLRYVVESTLTGNSDLKERTLGVEVFGRDPDYDTSVYPVVRISAGEVRKRIAQYYQEDGHEHEPRIILHPGSYTPEFEFPESKEAEQRVPPGVAPYVRSTAKPCWLLFALTVVLAGAITLAWSRPWASPAATDLFLAPFVTQGGPVLICVGQRGFLGSVPEPGDPQESIPELTQQRATAPDSPVTLFDLYYLGSQNVAFPDVIAISRISGLLQSKGKAVHVVGERATNLEDLRNGPVVLIGGFNNNWTLRLAGPMRFSFEREGDLFCLRDRQKPADRRWTVDYSMPYEKLARDYALISRVLEPTTGRRVIMIAGLTGFATMAASEFLMSAAQMEEMAAQAPANWDRKNLQMVIETKVIQGHSGSPRLIALHSW